jgi:uncharacterized protein
MAGVYEQGSSKRLDFPLPDVGLAELAPFWSAAAAGEFHLPFCDGCGGCRWYPASSCDACGAEPLTWKQLSGRGAVYSFTTVRHVFLPQYRDMVPFAAALVVPDGAPTARVATRLVGLDGRAVRCDARVEVRFEPLHFAGVAGEVIAPVFALSPTT